VTGLRGSGALEQLRRYRAALGTANPPALALVVGAVALAAGINLLDYLSGPYLLVSSFYLVPVALVSWYGDRRLGIAMGVLCAVGGLLATALHPEVLTPTVYVFNQGLRLAIYVLLAVLISTVRDAMRTLESLASIDPLTRLRNRRGFYERAELELARALRAGHSIAIVSIDLDNLKQCNDEEGHAAGDAMLTDLAAAARATFRVTDLIGRLGGDEFCVLLPDTDAAHANEAVVRLRRRLQSVAEGEIRFSAGVIGGPVHAGLDVGSALAAADHLMIAAKRNGKNRTETGRGFAEPDPARSAAEAGQP